MTTVAILDTLVNRAISTYPAEEARIRRAAGIVEAGLVVLDEQGRYRVGEHRYIVMNKTCNCLDFAHMTAEHMRCKHIWAKCLHHRLQHEECMQEALAPQPVKERYASYRGANGVAALFDDGSVRFQAYGETTWEIVATLLDLVTCVDNLVIGGDKAVIDAAWERSPLEQAMSR